MHDMSTKGKPIPVNVPVTYLGPRTAEAIVQHMKQQLIPSVQIFKSAADAKHWASRLKTGYLKEGGIAVVGFFKENTEEFKLFKSLANQLRTQYDFSVVTEGDASLFGVAGRDKVLL